MNKNSRNRRDKIEDMAFIKAITRFLSEDQYLKNKKNEILKYFLRCFTVGQEIKKKIQNKKTREIKK